jgi:hypothetical protein
MSEQNKYFLVLYPSEKRQVSITGLNKNQLFDKSINSKLIVKILSSICNVFNTQTMLSHCTSPINNHKNELIKTVITVYIKVRLHYEANKFNFKRVSLRQKYRVIINDCSPSRRKN